MAYGHQSADKSTDRLFVVNGELRGVSVSMEDLPIRIGLSSECDVVLLDDEQAGAEVTLDASSTGSPTLSDTIGRVSVGRRALKPKDNVVLRQGVSLHVGNSQLVLASSLSAADHSVRSGRRLYTGTFWAASLVVAVGVIGVIGLTGDNGAVTAKPISAFESADSGVNPVRPVSGSAAVAALRQRLEDAGLQNIRSSENIKNMTVSVAGTLQESQRQKWQAIRGWFDTRYGADMMMDVDIEYSTNSVTLPFSIEAVWGGSSPRVTLHDGSKRGVGELLPGGWRLDEIGMKSITISNNDDALMIPL